MTTTETDESAPVAVEAGGRRHVLLWVVVAAVVSGLVASLVTALVLRTSASAPEALPAPAPAPSVESTSAAPEQSTAPNPAQLQWAPPELEDPERIELTEDDRGVELDDDRDYELVLPDEPLEAEGGIAVVGGRNVVLIGGEISIPDNGQEEARKVRGVFLKDQTGTVHVEGISITGDGLGEGFNLDQRKGAVVQIQNVRIGTVQGEEDGHHADLIQSWAGPRELRVDGLTGSTEYQGFFLLPQQFGDQPEPELFDLRRIDITSDDGSYLLWRDGGDWPIETTDVYVAPREGQDDREDFLWPEEESSDGAWGDVVVGSPPGGEFVPEGVAGVGYTSPGYRGEG